MEAKTAESGFVCALTHTKVHTKCKSLSVAGFVFPFEVFSSPLSDLKIVSFSFDTILHTLHPFTRKPIAQLPRYRK